MVGLGNLGGEYDGTRHNVGFEVIRELCARHGVKLTERRFRAHYGFATFEKEGEVVCLAKPMTYMNLSGQAVSQLSRHFGIPSERVVIIYDEMDLDVARVQVKPKGGAGTHNGMKSIISSLGTQEFPRVRIGIGKPTVSGVDHVLSRFDRDEIEPIRDAIRRAADACELIVGSGIDIAMNRVNLPADAE